MNNQPLQTTAHVSMLHIEAMVVHNIFKVPSNQKIEVGGQKVNFFYKNVKKYMLIWRNFSIKFRFKKKEIYFTQKFPLRIVHVGKMKDNCH